MKHLMNKSRLLIIVLLLGAAGCAGTQTQSSTGEYLDDASITTKVKTGMIADETVSAHHISVVTTRGVVHLTGYATSKKEADRAESSARNVAGVASVNNDIQVK